MIQKRARRDAAAATPIDDVASRRRPTTPREFIQDVVPFPANALGERLVVALQVALAAPIILRPRAAIEKRRAEPFQRFPINSFPVHA